MLQVWLCKADSSPVVFPQERVALLYVKHALTSRGSKNACKAPVGTKPVGDGGGGCYNLFF